ncbi:hypothetical protein [Cephaloticoccus capnophilus]|uniref:hypothetical protein n=1 Tax=Cephaloticoccus capnophilus TaxID=1548208 RepID=UPI0012E7A611|nr:hypothetical protein [Cephaloticoccus capnophilus]
MSKATQRTALAATATALVGAGLGILAWLLPVNLKSLSPAQLAAAGRGTTALEVLGERFIHTEKLGPAMLVLAAARDLGAPAAESLADQAAALAAAQPALVPWGGWAPALEPILGLGPSLTLSSAEEAGDGEDAAIKTTPVLQLLISESARAALRASLASSRSVGVQTVLATREVAQTGRFVPAHQPGGQPLDAVILLSALLYQSEQFSPELRRELRELAAVANEQDGLGHLEEFYIDLLSLAQRLDWVQLAELVSRSGGSTTLGEYAHLARIAPSELPIIYTAAFFAGSADRVASYLIRYGKVGSEDLRLALGLGGGAVQQLVLRQVPIKHATTPALSELADFSIRHPDFTLALKYFGYLAAAFLIFRGVERGLLAPFLGRGAVETDGRKSLVQSGLLAVFAAGLLILATEPYLLAATESLSEYRFRISIPLLANIAMPVADSAEASASTTPSMNTSTVVSIAVFALLQVAIYFVCLRKIAEIRAQTLAPLLKLRLVENEDNLFDSGLYVGMMGTATALVLQVLGVIDHNLLAAYASNLFGLVCVALVKIRHVRGFKNALIIEAETAAARAVPSPAPVSA